MTDGPTRGAGETGTRTWGSRPWLARAVKTVAVLLPIAAAVTLATFVGPWLLRPAGLPGTALWFVQLAALSTATVVVVDRFARRLVPLAGLLGLSMMFPDEAPSRFGVALKAGTTKRLRAELDERPADETVNQAAARLLSMVSALNNHDRLTRGHTERVRAYSDLIAEEMALDEHDRWKLRWAVLLHDIGKLSVPPEILNKAGKPNDEEWAILRGHPGAGAVMVEPLADWLGEWRLAAGEHHERWDGKGYPNQLAGDQISLAGRIVAVADAYDVITSARSYKRPTDPGVAREELVRCAGSQFDPQVVRAFVNVSLGKLRLVGGPLAWIASLPVMGNVPGTIVAAATNAAVLASVVAATVVGGAAELRSSPSREVVQTAAASVSPATGGHGVAAGRRSSGAAGGRGTASGSSGASGGTPGSPSHHAGTSGADNPEGSGTHSGEAVDDSSVTDGGATTAPADGSAGPTTTTVGGPGSGSDDSSSRGNGGDSANTNTNATTTTTTAHSTTTLVAPPTTHATPATTVPPTTIPVGPTAVGDSFALGTLSQMDLTVLSNDVPGTTPRGSLTVMVTAGPSHGTATVQGSQTIRYKAAWLYLGTDALTYRICDPGGRCSSATVAISVGLL